MKQIDEKDPPQPQPLKGNGGYSSKGINCCLQIIVGDSDMTNGKNTTLYAGGQNPDEVKDLIKFGIEELKSLVGKGSEYMRYKEVNI